jgi:hypothetical protein
VLETERELTVGAVKVGKTKDIGSATLGGAVEAGAGSVVLASLELCRSSEGDAGEEGGDGGGELHFDGGDEGVNLIRLVGEVEEWWS